MPTALDRMNPPALQNASKVGYSQISIEHPSALAFVSGQVTCRPNGEPTPTSLAEQTAIVIENLQGALNALQAITDDIVQIRIYLTDLRDETQKIAFGTILRFLDGAKPSVTGIGVAALAGPDLQIEVEMVVQVAD